MTNGEINLLYAEVDKLLNDICKFLHEEIQDGFISPQRRSIANSLIDRSKKQLQTISMTVSLDTTESYVDMQAYKVNQHEDCPELEVYSDVSLTYEPTILSVSGEGPVICPFASMPASEIKEGKTGHLYKKEKILFFEQQKKVFGVCYRAWFLVYMNEHALKPCQTFDLSRYEVRPSTVQSKDTKKREESFDLVSIADSKLHQFTACTPKDMQQWLAAIKQQLDMIVTKRCLPPIPTSKPPDDFVAVSQEIKDQLLMKNAIPEDKEELNSSKVSFKIKCKKDPLPLPPRNPNNNVSKQYLPHTSSDDSLSSHYDSVTPGLINPSRESSNSFSGDDSDMHYDDPSEIRHQFPPNQNTAIDNYEDDDEIYDCLEKSALHQNTVSNALSKVPAPIPEVQSKPPPNLKPKLILSFRQRMKK